MADDLDEEFARYVASSGMATAEQIRAARFAQQTAGKKGQKIALSDILVQQGIITASHRENVKKKLTIQAAGLQKLGRYRLIKKLGEGGMGAVYLANDPTLQRKVAIKILSKRYAEDPEFLARFRREAQATGRLNHPNIIAAFHVDEELGTHYYVMEYLEGNSCDEILKKNKTMPVNDALEIALHVARGLEYAHKEGLVHRDIKPGNIFKTNDGAIKILDMGLSKNIHRADSQFSTQSGIALGTPHYIAPEQARGAKDVDGRTDIYSLGASLYHCLTGETPFQGSTPAVIMTKHLTEELPNPQDLREDVPIHVVQVIRRMMAKHPDDRYANCGELAADLELISHGEPPASPALDAGRSSVALNRLSLRRALSLRRGRSAGTSTLRTRRLLTGFVLVGAIALGTVAALYDILITKKQPDPAKTVVQNVDPAKPNREPKTPAPKAGEQLFSANHWKDAVDLLALVDPALDRINGDWKKQDGELSVARGSAARIQVPYQPPSEYDYLIEFTRSDGSGEVKQVASKLGRTFQWTMGASSNSICGFESINGNDVRGSPSKAERAAWLTNGQRHTAIVQVRNDGVRGWLDGAAISEYSTDFSDFTATPAWFMPDQKALGLGADGSVAVFHKAKLKEITGKGKAERRSAAAPVIAAKSLDLLSQVDLTRDQVKGHWRSKDGLLYSDEFNRQTDLVGVVEFPYQPPEEYDYTVTFTRYNGLGDVVLALNGGGKPFHLTVGSRGGLESCLGLINGKWTGAENPSKRVHSNLYRNGDQCVLRAEVRRDGVTAFFNGKLLTEWKTNFADMSPHAMFALRTPHVLGVGNYGNDVSFHSVQIVEVTGKGRLLHQPVLASEETWKQKAISLLPLVNPQQDAQSGQWQKHEDGLTVAHGQYSRLQLPYQPPPEYDFRVTFTRLNGNATVAQLLHKDERTFCWLMGAAENRVNGFEAFSGVRAPDNPHSRKQENILASGRKHTALVQVRNRSVRAFVDGELQSEFNTDYKNAGVMPEWTLGHLKCLGLGVHFCSAVFHSAEVLEITGRGALLRPPVAPVAAPPTEEQWQQAVNLLGLIDPDKDRVNGRWHFHGGALVSGKSKVDAGGSARIAVPYQPPEEYDLRVSFERVEGARAVHQLLSHNGKQLSFFVGENENQHVGIGRINGANVTVNGQLANRRRYTSLVQVRKDRVRVFLDGVPIVDQPVDWSKAAAPGTWELPASSLLGFGSDDSITQFFSAQLLPVTGAGKRMRAGKMEQGLWASYWSGDPNTAFKKFHFGQPARQLNFNVNDASPHEQIPVDYFGIRFCGFIKIEQAGNYTFHSGDTNDYLAVLIDDEVVLQAKAPTPASRSRKLQPGLRKITITYSEARAAARLDLKWSSEQQREPSEIPAAVLFYDPVEVLEYQKP